MPKGMMATEQTAAEALQHSAAVRESINTIIDELKQAQSRLTGVRGPVGDRAGNYDQLLADAAETRGRGLYYPYIGSGVGNGALVELADGSVKFDMISGIGVQFFGHSDPDLTAVALEGAMADTVMQGNLQMNEEAIRFAETLIEQAASESFDPTVYRDDVRDQVMALIQRKIEGEDISVAPAEKPERKIIDLMEALKASLNAPDKRKPAKRTDAEQGEAKKANAKKTNAKGAAKATSRKAPRKKRAS